MLVKALYFLQKKRLYFLKRCDGLDLVFLGNHDMDKVPEERTICPGVWKTNKSIIIVVEGGKGASCIYYCCAQTTYSFKPCFFPSMLCSLISSSPDRWLAFSTSRLSTQMIGISQPPSGCASAVTQSRQAKKTCSTMSSGSTAHNLQAWKLPWTAGQLHG